jgi:hypothetical protein
MLDHEEGVREGCDIEHVRNMRVATRRMRAALRVFANYLDAVSHRPFVKMLRRTGRTLGAVRDLDVFFEKTQHYLDTLPADRKSELDGLLAAWQAEHHRQRPQLADPQRREVLIEVDKALHLVDVEIRPARHNQFLRNGIDPQVAFQGARGDFWQLATETGRNVLANLTACLLHQIKIIRHPLGRIRE